DWVILLQNQLQSKWQNSPLVTDSIILLLPNMIRLQGLNRRIFFRQVVISFNLNDNGPEAYYQNLGTTNGCIKTRSAQKYTEPDNEQQKKFTIVPNVIVRLSAIERLDQYRLILSRYHC